MALFGPRTGTRQPAKGETTFSRLVAVGVRAGGVQLASKLAAFATAVLLARWLGPAGYGSYAFVTAVVFLLVIPAKFGFSNLALREVARASADDIQRGVGALLLRVGLLVALISLAVVGVSRLAIGLLDPVAAPALAVGLWLVPGLALLSVPAAALRSLDQVVTSRFLETLLPALLLLALLSAAVFWAPHRAGPILAIELRIFALVLALALAVWLCLRRMQTLGMAGQGTLVHSTGTMVWEAYPFMLIGASNIVMARIDVVILGGFISEADVGLYSVALQVGSLVLFSLNIANSVVAPEFAKLHLRHDMKALQALSVSSARLVFALSVVMAIPLVVFGADLLAVFFGEPYREARTVLEILALGYLAATLFGSPGFLLNMTGHQRVTMRVLLAAAAVNIVLNLMLIPALGMIGAAIATAVSLAGWRVAAYLLVRNKLGIGCAAYSRIGISA